LQQRQQGGAGIEVALAVGQVGMGQQHLRAAQAMLAQLGLVHLGQAHLAHGGGGLQFMDFMRAVVQPRRFMPSAIGTAGHHDHFAAVTHQQASWRHHSPMAARPARDLHWSPGWSRP
jgi:hypothetical protein